MFKPLTIAVSIDDLIAELRKSPSADGLSLATLRTVLTVGGIVATYVSVTENGEADPIYSKLVAQVAWLADEALKDDGKLTDDDRAPVLDAAATVIAGLIEQATANQSAKNAN